jgi:hypothetical protein
MTEIGGVVVEYHSHRRAYGNGLFSKCKNSVTSYLRHGHTCGRWTRKLGPIMQDVYSSIENNYDNWRAGK